MVSEASFDEVLEEVEEEEDVLETTVEQIETVEDSIEEFEASEEEENEQDQKPDPASLIRVHATMRIMPSRYLDDVYLSISIEIEGKPNECDSYSGEWSSGGLYGRVEYLDYEIMTFIEKAMWTNVPSERIHVVWEDNAREIYKRLYVNPVLNYDDEPTRFLVQKLEDPYLYNPQHSLMREIKIEGIINGLLKNGVAREDIERMLRVKRRKGLQKLLQYELNDRKHHLRRLKEDMIEIMDILKNGTARKKVAILELTDRKSYVCVGPLRDFRRDVARAEEDEKLIQLIAKELEVEETYSDSYLKMMAEVNEEVSKLNFEQLIEQAKREKEAERRKEKQEKEREKMKKINWADLI